MNIIKLFPGDPDYHLFQQVPDILFPDNKIRKLQGDEINTEFLDSCLLLMDDRQAKGRLTLYVNPNLKYNGELVLCMGNYECSESQRFSDYLLRYVYEEARRKNLRYVLGPMNGSTWNDYRFKIDNDRPPFFLEPEHPVYYNRQLLDSGFRIISEYASYLVDDLTKVDTFDNNTKQQLESMGITIRPIDHTNYGEELSKLYTLSISGFKDNLFFTSISWESFVERYKPLKAHANHSHTLIAENENGETVGFLFAIEDIFCRTEKRLIIKTNVRKKTSGYDGLGSALLSKINTYAIENEYRSLLHAFMISGSKFEVYSAEIGKLYRTYRLYLKEI